MTANSPHGLTADDVRWVYRVLLDREPESERIVRENIGAFTERWSLVEAVLESAEYRKRTRHLRRPTLEGSEPPLRIELEPTDAELERLFSHIEKEWRELGEVEPHWSVSSGEKFKAANIDENIDAFYARGRAIVRQFLRSLRRNEIDPGGLNDVLDFGCGLCRISRWLADHFETVHALDISSSHLHLANSMLADVGITNVQTAQLTLDRLTQLPPVDAIVSIIVLQHNPPPLISKIVDNLLDTLRPGGVAYFQVPTYRADYEFVVAEYLRTGIETSGMEMHVVPQSHIFELAERHDCRIVEVLEDGWAGLRSGEVSNTFLVQKRAGTLADS